MPVRHTFPIEAFAPYRFANRTIVTVDGVVAGATVNRVIALFAKDQVVARAAINDVITRSACTARDHTGIGVDVSGGQIRIGHRGVRRHVVKELVRRALGHRGVGHKANHLVAVQLNRVNVDDLARVHVADAVLVFRCKPVPRIARDTVDEFVIHQILASVTVIEIAGRAVLHADSDGRGVVAEGHGAARDRAVAQARSAIDERVAAGIAKRARIPD